MEPLSRVRLKQFARRAYETGERVYLTPELRHEEGVGLTAEVSESGFYYAAALKALTEHPARDVLDVGTGLVAWPRLLADCGFVVTAIDKYDKTGYWGRRPFNRHYLVRTDDITRPQLSRRFDGLTCMHVMMSIPDHQAAVAGMCELVRPDGIIVMSFPYNEHTGVENMYAHPDAGYGQNFAHACRVYCKADIDSWLARHPIELIHQERYRVFSGELWTMGQRIPPTAATADEPHHFTTVIFRRTAD